MRTGKDKMKWRNRENYNVIICEIHFDLVDNFRLTNFIYLFANSMCLFLI